MRSIEPELLHGPQPPLPDGVSYMEASQGEQTAKEAPKTESMNVLNGKHVNLCRGGSDMFLQRLAQF